jgi:hypothetical protein
MATEFEPSLAEWALCELADNRRKEQVKAKQYDQEAVVKALHAGGPFEAHWACQDMLAKLKAKPELLQQ